MSVCENSISSDVRDEGTSRIILAEAEGNQVVFIAAVLRRKSFQPSAFLVFDNWSGA